MPVDIDDWDATYTYWAAQPRKRRRIKRDTRAPEQELPRPFAPPAAALPLAAPPRRQAGNAAPARPLAARAAAAAALSSAAVIEHEASFAKRLELTGHREAKRGLYVVGAAVGLAGLWACFVPLSGGVVTGGSVVASSSAKTIQPAVGGVIQEILVNDGTRVIAGQSLLRLDPTTARAGLAAIDKRLLEVRATIRRLTAERDGDAAAAGPLAGVDNVGSAQAAPVMAAQQSLLEARANSRQQQIGLLGDRIAQLGIDARSAQAQLAAKIEERGSVESELTGVESLLADHLVTLPRVTALRRDKSRLDGDIGMLQATIAETKSKISEARLQIEHFRQDFQVQVLSDLNDAQAKEGDLVGQQTAAQQQLEAMDIHAPRSGIVHDLAVHTIGGVVTPAEILMLVAPDTDDLEIEAQLQPKDVDQVAVGQTARLRFAAFDRNATPELRGTVTYVSPDTTKDPRSNTAVYKVRIAIDGPELGRLGDLHLIAGMPAEIVLATGSRTFISYLMKPLTDQAQRMFRGR